MAKRPTVSHSFRLVPTLRRDRLASLDRKRLPILDAQRMPADDHHDLGARPSLLAVLLAFARAANVIGT
jgi:hypothetical protein